jgi:hypothetical protein
LICNLRPGLFSTGALSDIIILQTKIWSNICLIKEGYKMNRKITRSFIIQLIVALALLSAIALYFLGRDNDPGTEQPAGAEIPGQIIVPETRPDQPKPVEIEELSVSESIRAESGELIFRYIISLPKISGGSAGVSDIINAYYDGLREGIKNGDIQRIRDFAEADHSAPNFISAYSYSQDYEIVLNDGEILSIRRIIDTFEGGAQSRTFMAFDVLSLKTGERLPLASLFNESYKERHIALLMERVSHMIKEDEAMSEAFFASEPEELAEVFNPENYCLDEDSLILLFQAYDIAPNTFGIPEFKIPLSELSDMLAKR